MKFCYLPDEYRLNVKKYILSLGQMNLYVVTSKCPPGLEIAVSKGTMSSPPGGTNWPLIISAVKEMRGDEVASATMTYTFFNYQLVFTSENLTKSDNKHYILQTIIPETNINHRSHHFTRIEVFSRQ